MMKSKAVLRTAVASAVLAAITATAGAGTLTTTARNVAQEAFGTGASATVNGAGLVYTFATPGGIVINPGGTIYVTIFPSAGNSFGASGASTLSLTVPTTAGGTLTTSTVAIDASGNIVVSLINSGGTNTVLGVGAALTIGAGAAGNANAGGAGLVSITYAASLASGTAVTATGAVGTAAAGSNLESPTAVATTLVTSSLATTGAFALQLLSLQRLI